MFLIFVCQNVGPEYRQYFEFNIDVTATGTFCLALVGCSKIAVECDKLIKTLGCP